MILKPAQHWQEVSNWLWFTWNLFCCFCVSKMSNGGENEDYNMCELINGRSRFFNFSYFLMLAVRYTNINICYLLLLLLTAPI